MVDSTQLLAEATSLRDTKGNLTGALEKIGAILDFDSQDPVVWIQKAIIERDSGDLEESERSVRKALEHCMDDNQILMATAKRLHAELLLLYQDFDKAHTLATESVAMARLSENKEVLSLCSNTLARVLFGMQVYADAAKQSQIALEIAQEVHFSEGELRATLTQAQVTLAQEPDTVAAVKRVESVIERAENRLLAVWFEALYIRAMSAIECDAAQVQQLQKAYKIAANNGWAIAHAMLAHALGAVLQPTKSDTAITYFKTAVHVYNQAHVAVPEDIRQYAET